MNEFLKCTFIVLLSVFCSIHIGHTVFEEKIQKSSSKVERISQKQLVFTNYVTITNWVTVTNFVSEFPKEESLIEPGIPIQKNTNSTVSFDISPPTEAETRLRNISKELIDLLENIKTSK